MIVIYMTNTFSESNIEWVERKIHPRKSNQKSKINLFANMTILGDLAWILIVTYRKSFINWLLYWGYYLNIKNIVNNFVRDIMILTIIYKTSWLEITLNFWTVLIFLQDPFIMYTNTNLIF